MFQTYPSLNFMKIDSLEHNFFHRCLRKVSTTSCRFSTVKFIFAHIVHCFCVYLDLNKIHVYAGVFDSDKSCNAIKKCLFDILDP